MSKITLVLRKNDLHQADNSGFPGVNHPCFPYTCICRFLIQCKQFRFFIKNVTFCRVRQAATL